jgi:hypothetical protein
LLVSLDLTYSTPSSAVVNFREPFSVSLNNQQNTKQEIDFVYYDKPHIARLEPNKGPDYGNTKVKIRGQHFNPTANITLKNYNDTFCRFGNVSVAQAKVISSTEMECDSPPSYEDRALTVEITLNNRDWTRDGLMFYYYHPPFVYFIQPTIGPVDGGTEVSVIGSNFEDTGIVLCKFGDIMTKGQYINENELKCISPRVEKPTKVPLTVAIRDDEFSSGMNTMYRYYADPVIDSIEPACGPERGFTQITIRGDKFPEQDSEYVKCVFDRKIFMNATVLSENEIKCDSPSVLNYAGINEKNVTEYDLELSLNGIDITGPVYKFYYYKETIVTGVNPIFGPIEGNTQVNITGYNFNQKGACNVTVRFSTYHIKPSVIESEYLIVNSPKVNFTGAVVVQVALNGRQFEKDITVNFRDKENTFIYYRNPLITEFRPVDGPTIGGTEVDVYGVGFDEPFKRQDGPKDKTIYYRFVNCDNEETIYGEVGNTTVSHSHWIKVSTPAVYQNDTQACIQTSYNGQNFSPNPGKKFTYYSLPNIVEILPKYGPLKLNNQEIRLKLDNYYCTSNCDRLLCRFTSKNSVFYEKGSYISPNNVNCTVPRVNIPDSFVVEMTSNGRFFTNNGLTFTFYEPYVIKVTPQMISSKGNTQIRITGFGFADTGDNLKVRFGSNDGPLKCDLKNCIIKGTYIDQNTIDAVTFPRRLVKFETTDKNVGYERFAVEVSIYNDDFTNNNITIFYYDEPLIINDLNVVSDLDPNDKKALNDVLLKSLPANLDTFIPIPINGTNINDNYDQMEPFSNYTCKFEMAKNPEVYKITYGVVTSFPYNSGKRNLFLCQSPVWDQVGDSNIKISLNGQDFSENSYKLQFTDPLDIVKMTPTCGPLNGGTQISMYGSGFSQDNLHTFKWGVQNLVTMDTSSFLDYIRYDDISLIQQSQFKIMKMNILSPEAPDRLKSLGGLDYITLSRINSIPISDYIKEYQSNLFVKTNHEYYYYKQPYVQGFTPHGSIVSGGTDVIVIGAWFQYKPEYGVKPYCKFGDKIVEGQYLSTVRIKCTTPPYDKTNVRIPFDISLNGVDFTNSGLTFIYFNDFRYAKFDKVEPASGPDVGGTQIKLYGSNFTNLVNPEEFLCQFRPSDKNMAAKNVPAGYKELADNTTMIICNSPGGWSSGTKADILITFDGQNFMDTKFDFYFYKIDKVVPMAGPSLGNGPINIIGGGFMNSDKVKCSLNNIAMKPIQVTEKLIQCPMLPSSSKNFTGAVEFSVMLNGIDKKSFSDGFYYYTQPSVTSIFPKSGPNKGNGIVKAFGSGFRKDFNGANLGCKVGEYHGKGEYVTDNEMHCYFNKIPLIEEGRYMNFSLALNDYSFTQDNANLTYVPYGVINVRPSSAPIVPGTRLRIRGKGFYPTKNIRCRFGVDGYYFYTNAHYISYEEILCSTPENYQVPLGAQLPFSVPFSVAFNDDEFSKNLSLTIRPLD